MTGAWGIIHTSGPDYDRVHFWAGAITGWKRTTDYTFRPWPATF